MALTIATWLVRALALYALLGLVFGIRFVARGVGRIDPAAREGTWGFRLVILPGVVALWPLLLLRFRAGAAEPPIERNAHRRGSGQAHRRAAR